MDAARWRQIDELLDAALEVAPAERESFVTERSGGDHDLRRQVLELLRADEKADGYLHTSAMHLAARAIADAETEVSAFAFVNKKIATYRVERMLGAGGMGEVYLAFDEKLNRRVALKILPSEFLSNDERVKRFELEARAISRLNHPGIVTVYDVGNFEGVNYIATEFVEGKTLRDLIGGGFKIRNIVLNSIQICDALAAAHAQGIIHRDIKPENIMIRKDGYAKILDFGLVKLTDPGNNTVRELLATTKGVIIGTPAYMSPAQVTDDKIDHRTDLWSCGVVLYEFLTGQNPFKGASRQETFQAILSREPALCSSVNPAVPDELARIVAKLLEKDPAKGYQTASELRSDLRAVQRELDSSQSSSGSTWRGAGITRSPLSSIALAGAVTAILIGLAGLTYWFYFVRKDPAAIDWTAAKNVKITDQAGVEFFPSISPGGDFLVYAAEENGQFDIFSQRIGEKTRQNLTLGQTAHDSQPSLSPDGRRIAFRSERTPKGIYLMGPSGEDPKHISEVGYHPAWSPDGKEIVVSSFGRDQPTVRSNTRHALMVINLETGLRREISNAEASFPSWSPHGNRIAYWFHSGSYGRRQIATIPANGGDPVVVAEGFAVSNWNPVWSPDGKYLYFVSSRAGNMNFWRVRIDEATGQTLSEPEAVITPSKYSRHLSFSRDGKRLVYVQTNDQSNVQGVDFDAAAGRTTGAPFWITQGDREVSRAELSHDGSRFVMRLIRPTQDDIVIVDREGDQWKDVTNDEPFDRYVRWSPDGKQIAFASDRNEGGQVWVANADRSDMRQLTFNSTESTGTGFPIWSPDGSKLAVYFNGTTYLLDPIRNEKEQDVEKLPVDPKYGFVAWDWSPDGTKLLGVISEGEKRHIGYFSFEAREYIPVIENVDEVPSWLPDSRRFIYSVGSRIMIGEIGSNEPKELFRNPQVDIRSPFVSKDGKLLYYTAGNYESDIWLLDLTAER